MRTTEAWVLHAGDPAATGPASLQRDAFPLNDLLPQEALVEPIYGSWEANMSHALSRRPIDVPRARREDRVVLGNCGLVRVMETGAAVTHVSPGDLCIIGNGARWDRFGYPEQVWAYDWPGSIGFLAKQAHVVADILLPVPAGSRFSPMQWAAFGVRYATAYSNWDVAYRCWRAQVHETDMPKPFVWGWGGGSSLGSVHLAAVMGFPAVMITASDARRTLCAALGIQTVDRRAFPTIAFDEPRFAADAVYRSAYKVSEDAFYQQVLAMTDNLGASIFFDYLGSPVIRATLRALARQGVVSTAGWKHGMSITSMRAIECIRRHIHVHTHYVRRGQIAEAMRFAEETGWMVPRLPDEKVWAWDDIPALAAAFDAGAIDSYFPLYQVNPL